MRKNLSLEWRALASVEPAAMEPLRAHLLLCNRQEALFYFHQRGALVAAKLYVCSLEVSEFFP